MSQKYSITSSSSNNNTNSRRKSIFTPNTNTTSTGEASLQTLELERLEQEITLTLQTIDKTFSRSHKIINDRLIPIVNKYHANSKRIWSGVNFWKTFLEASANVELRGYEEAHQNDSGEMGEAQTQRSGDDNIATDLRSDSTDAQMRENEELSPVKVPTSMGTQGGDDILMESTDYTTNQKSKGKDLTNNPIMPQVNRQNIGFDTTDSIIPSLPPVTVNLTNTNETDVNQTTPTLQRNESRHYVLRTDLDTTYKLEVSPRKARKRESVVASMTPNRGPNKKRKSFYQEKFDSSPFEVEPPQLRSDVQFSPVRKNASPLKKNQNQPKNKTSLSPDENETQRFPLTPRYGAGGKLLRTPRQVENVAKRFSDHNLQHPDISKELNNTSYNTGFEDSEEASKLSPPVTINFATAQHEKEIDKAPAREVAQNMVKDMLNNVSGIDDSVVDMNKSTADNSLFNEKENEKGNDTNHILSDDFDAFLDRPEEKNKEKDDWSE